MAEEFEYDDVTRTMLDLIWGEGYMSPGGNGNIANLVRGLDIRDKRILDVGSGQGSPAFFLAENHGAHVVGIDIEPELVALSRNRARERGLQDRTEFILVEPGPMDFLTESFDFVLSSSGFTQIENKFDVLKEILRVLKPCGVFSCYDWMKNEGEYSQEMLHFFEMEGLTYNLETPASQSKLLQETGFIQVTTDDRSEWYRLRAQEELTMIQTELYPRMVELMGKNQADHFVENWHALTVVCDRGDLLQVYNRGHKPERETPSEDCVR